MIDRCSKEIMKYDANFEILAEDLQHKIDGLAKTFMTKTGETAFPYQPLTTVGKDITFRGKMDLETFRKFAASHPDALYSEMKLLSYFMIAENSQINQLHDIAAKLNLSVENLLVWCDTLNSEQVRFVQIDDDDDDARDTDRTALAQAAQELVDANHKVDDLEKEITELNASIALLVRRQASPSSAYTSESTNSDKTRRSTKIENAPIFHGDGDKDALSFESWYRQIENKLAVNADHFDNDLSKQVYIEGRIQGTVAANLAPYLRTDNPDRVKTSKDLLKHLWDEYHDPCHVPGLLVRLRAPWSRCRSPDRLVT